MSDSAFIHFIPFLSCQITAFSPTSVVQLFLMTSRVRYSIVLSMYCWGLPLPCTRSGHVAVRICLSGNLQHVLAFPENFADLKRGEDDSCPQHLLASTPFPTSVVIVCRVAKVATRVCTMDVRRA